MRDAPCPALHPRKLDHAGCIAAFVHVLLVRIPSSIRHTGATTYPSKPLVGDQRGVSGADDRQTEDAGRKGKPRCCCCSATCCGTRPECACQRPGLNAGPH